MSWSIKVGFEGIQLEGNTKSQKKKKREWRYDSGNRKELDVIESKLQEFILANILEVHFSKYYILVPLSSYILACKWAAMLTSIDGINGHFIHEGGKIRSAKNWAEYNPHYKDI